MMRLMVDIGNSTISLGLFADKELLRTSYVSMMPHHSAEQYAAEFASVLDISRTDIDGAAVSSVVAPLTSVVCTALERGFGVRPLTVHPGVKTGLNIRLSNAVHLGSDFVCAAVGALAAYPPPLVIADLGTATTVMGIHADGRLLGTSIMPGVGTGAQALKTAAANLPLTGAEMPTSLLGVNTVDAMKSGLVFGTASMLDGMCARYERELGGKATRILTGGYAERIYPACEGAYILRPHLVLEGLHAIYLKNRKD